LQLKFPLFDEKVRLSARLNLKFEPLIRQFPAKDNL